MVSEKSFDEEMTINHLTTLLKKNDNETNNDLENFKKENNYFLKIQNCFKGCDLTFYLNIKKTKLEKMKVCVRMKENGFEDLEKDKNEMIGFIKKQISFDLLKELI